MTMKRAIFGAFASLLLLSSAGTAGPVLDRIKSTGVIKVSSSDGKAIDAAIAAGQNPGPLAGVPFAVKNFFDVQGLSTRAGSRINRDLKPSSRDATLIGIKQTQCSRRTRKK